PKRGFTNLFAKEYSIVNLGRLQSAIDAGKVDAKAEINHDVLVAAGVVRAAKDGLRLLAKGELKAKVNLVVAHASPAAITAVEKAGGKVQVNKAEAVEA
ncbi:MAG: uL15m family ribosomal protein, partial [Sphingomonadales bacterium]